MSSLRFRLTLWFSLAVTATAAAAGWIGYLVVRQQMISGIDFLLEAEIQEVIARLGDSRAAESRADTLRRIEAHTEIDAPLYYFQIRLGEEGTIFRSRNLANFTLPATISTAGATITIDDTIARVRAGRHGDYTIEVATNLEQTEALIGRYERSLLVSLPLLFGFSLLVGWWMATIALGPIGAMQRAARRISASQLSERLPVPPGRDEIASLARLLNDLFARLEKSFDQVRRFTADASHELKTPLSLIRLHAERLAQSPGLSDVDRAALGEQLEEIARLNKLVENLLLLARADAGSLALERRWQNVADFARGFSEDANALAEESERHFSISRNDEGDAEFDASLFRQVALNLLANALRHSPPGGTIRMDSRLSGGSWYLGFEDDGPGVAPDALDAIFKRFVRAPSATDKSGTAGGSGLGLAIARSIVEAHGGTIKASNRATGGLRVEIHLPGARSGVRSASGVGAS